jgi:hypothetical protein
VSSGKVKRFRCFDFDNWAQNLTFSVAPDGVVAQLVERLNGIQEVRGSNPLGSTIRPRGDQRFARNRVRATLRGIATLRRLSSELVPSGAV